MEVDYIIIKFKDLINQTIRIRFNYSTLKAFVSLSATLFEVTVIKNSRGLGLSMTGGIESTSPWAGLVRIKKIYPQTPAWLCGQLQIGDIILEANSNFLTGLTSHVSYLLVCYLQLDFCVLPTKSSNNYIYTKHILKYLLANQYSF